MNKKEVSEIRRRLSPERSSIQHVYGCYVNAEGKIIARVDEALSVLPREEQEKYISLLKKSLSGGLGKNLMDLRFSTKQVVESDEHKLLSALRRSELKEPVILEEFYKCVTEHLNLKDSSYLVLLAYDTYDVPQFTKDGMTDDSGRDVFRYILCAVCPVKTPKSVLHFEGTEQRFRNLSLAQTVASPELGFMFPAFDDRSANIYNALFYSRDTKGVHSDFIDAVFRTEVPMSAGQQREAFGTALKDTLKKDCSLEVVRAVHSALRQKVLVHKESKDPEPLTVSVEEVAEVLEGSGVSDEKLVAFTEDCRKQMGGREEFPPENVIGSGKFEISTETVKIKVDPDFTAQIRTEVIDGKRYILIPAEGTVEVNGIAVSV